MQSSPGTFLCRKQDSTGQCLQGFAWGNARESQCKSGPFLKKVACVDKYLFMAMNMPFLSFFLKLELCSKLFKGNEPEQVLMKP